MAPSRVSVTEESCSGDHVWRVRLDDGTVILPPTSGTNDYSEVHVLLGTYEIQVDVDNEGSVTTSHELFNYPAGAEAVSFFDANGNIFTWVLETVCDGGVLVDNLNQQPCGGIDILKATNGLCYVGLNDIRLRFPNGVSQGVDLENNSLDMIDIEIDNERGFIYMALNRFGAYFLVRTTPNDIASNILEGFFPEEYFSPDEVQQIAYDPSKDMIFFTNSTSQAYFLDAEYSQYPEANSFGNGKKKTALAFDANSGKLIIAQGKDNCTLLMVDPEFQQVMEEIPIECNGFIHSMDINPSNGDIYYTDDSNVWRFNPHSNDPPIPLIADFSNTLDTEGKQAKAMRPPFADIVFVQYD